MNDKKLYTVFRQKESNQFYHRWNTKEDILLKKAVEKHGPNKWTMVASCIPGRTAVQCSTRWFGALNSDIQKGKWSKAEDQILKDTVHHHQSITMLSSSAIPWNQVAEKIQRRTGVQCQARWTEALDPSIQKGRWSEQENQLLKEAVAQYGCCWIRVSSLIPTRTQRQCRTRWNQMKRLKTMHNGRKVTLDTRSFFFENDAYTNSSIDSCFSDSKIQNEAQNMKNLPTAISMCDDFVSPVSQYDLFSNNSALPFSPENLNFDFPTTILKQDAYNYNAISTQLPYNKHISNFYLPLFDNFCIEIEKYE